MRHAQKAATAQVFHIRVEVNGQSRMAVRFQMTSGNCELLGLYYPNFKDRSINCISLIMLMTGHYADMIPM